MFSVTKHGSFSELRDVWDPLVAEASARGPFLTWEWQRLWWETFAADQEPLLLLARDGDGVQGIAPLSRRDGVITFACGCDVSDFLDVIARKGKERAVVAAFWAYLREQSWSELDLCCLHPDALLANLLAPLVQADGLQLETAPRDVSPVLDLPADWETYLGSLPKKDRHELRRKTRRLAETEQARSYALVDREIGVREVDDFLALHRLSTPEKAIFMDERMEGFFREVFARFAHERYLRLYFAEVEGRRVSSAICFDDGEEFLLYNSGYDPAYSRLSVGLLLKAFCLRDAIALGRRRFDFLRGNERYKYDLGGRDVPVLGLRVGRRS